MAFQSGCGMPDKPQEQDPRLAQLLRILRAGRLTPQLVAHDLRIGLSEAEALLRDNSGDGGPLLVTVNGSTPWYSLRNPPPQEQGRARSYAPPPSREETARRLGLQSGPREWPVPPQSRYARAEAPSTAATTPPEDPRQRKILDLLGILGASRSVVAATSAGDYTQARLYAPIQLALAEDRVTRLQTEIAALNTRQLSLRELVDLITELGSQTHI